MNLAETYVGKKVIEQGGRLVMQDPEGNLSRLAWARSIARDPRHRQAKDNVKRFLGNKDSNWYQLTRRLLQQTLPNVKERMAIAFFSEYPPARHSQAEGNGEKAGDRRPAGYPDGPN
ncbi:MAG: hypothetical protein ACOY3C_03140 [Bacillota bacterium]